MLHNYNSTCKGLQIHLKKYKERTNMLKEKLVNAEDDIYMLKLYKPLILNLDFLSIKNWFQIVWTLNCSLYLTLMRMNDTLSILACTMIQNQTYGTKNLSEEWSQDKKYLIHPLLITNLQLRKVLEHF